MTKNNESVATSVREIRVGRIAGLSAYELAVMHGYTGTEEEFSTEQFRLQESIKNLNKKVDDLLKRLPEGISLSVDENGELIINYDSK